MSACSPRLIALVATAVLAVLAALGPFARPAFAATTMPAEQGRFLYSFDYRVPPHVTCILTSGCTDEPAIKGTATDAFDELHRCFNCSFPVQGAPAAFPTWGQFVDLKVCLAILGCGKFPVKFYPDETRHFIRLVAQAGHFEGEGSTITFSWYTSTAGELHLADAAFVTKPLVSDATIKGFASVTWRRFATQLGHNMRDHGCPNYTCPPPPPPPPLSSTIDLRTDCPTLQQGSSGVCVQVLQNLLNRFGAGLTVDGIFGPATAAAVRRFQSRNGLVIDGIVGPHTKSALYGSPTAALDLRTSCGLLSQGSGGRCVAELQRLLNTHGFGLVIDGDFGSATASAVRSFQSSHGLLVDGIVGPRTKAALYGTSTSGVDLRFDCPNLQQGSTGACVSQLQRLLNSHGFSLSVDGIFGSLTDSAVRTFQSRNGLAVDGIVGPQTKAVLYHGGGPGPSGVDLQSDCGVLAQGSSGPCVSELQNLLNSHGANLAVDGLFGSLTDSAVRTFQADNGLDVDGIVGPHTKAALAGGGASGLAGGVDLRADCGLLQEGSSGPCVVELQDLLDSHGADLAVDGIFGPLTDGAVRTFQSTHGLTVDGIVGPQTKAALYSVSVQTPDDPIVTSKVIAAARVAVQRAIPYSWGGGHAGTPGPSLGTCVGYTGSIQPCPASHTVGLDCSGLVRWAYWVGAHLDLGNGGNTDAQFRSPHSLHISESAKVPGDLEFFGTTSDTHHVVIYSGVINGVPMMIEENRTGTNAHESPLRTGGLWVHVV
jgi:peptidoglycan hydrolase-like protein with peptidoglycan-binding domain